MQASQFEGRGKHLTPPPKQDGEGQTGGRCRLGAMKAKTILLIAVKATVTSSSCISKEELYAQEVCTCP